MRTVVKPLTLKNDCATESTEQFYEVEYLVR